MRNISKNFSFLSRFFEYFFFLFFIFGGNSFCILMWKCFLLHQLSNRREKKILDRTNMTKIQWKWPFVSWKSRFVERWTHFHFNRLRMNLKLSLNTLLFTRSSKMMLICHFQKLDYIHSLSYKNCFIYRVKLCKAQLLSEAAAAKKSPKGQ